METPNSTPVEFWSSRKLKIALYFAHGWILLLLLGKLDQNYFVDLEIMTIGGYFISNVGEWWAKR